MIHTVYSINAIANLFISDGARQVHATVDEDKEAAESQDEGPPPKDPPEEEEKLVILDVLMLSKAKSECICCPRKVTKKCTTLPTQARIQVKISLL